MKAIGQVAYVLTVLLGAAAVVLQILVWALQALCSVLPRCVPPPG